MVLKHMVLKRHGLKKSMVLKTRSQKNMVLNKAICEQFGIDFQSCYAWIWQLKRFSLRCIKIDTNVQLCYNEIEDFLLIRNAYLFWQANFRTGELFYIIFRNLSEN